MRRLILVLLLVTACASKSGPPVRPAAWVRDDGARPDLVTARRGYAACDASARIAYDTAPRQLLIFGVPGKRYKRALANCMRSSGWILLPKTRTDEPLPDGAIAPKDLRCVGRTC